VGDTVSRHIHLLRHIPQHGRISVTELLARLHGDGYRVERRTIERDLNKLSSKFAIAGDNTKPQGWSWVKGSTLIQLPALSPAMALTYRLVGDYLARLLPREMHSHLGPQLDLANATLAASSGGLHDWSHRVAMVPMGPDRPAPVTDETVMATVYDALLQNRCLEVRYRAANAEAVKEHLLNPLALVVMDEVVYLVASFVDGDDPYQFALHRMSAAVLLDEQAQSPPEFTLRRYLQEMRGFQYSHQWPITLELKVNAWLARQLQERPLAPGQTVRPMAGGEHFRVVARLDYSDQLHWWLHSFGSAVEVLKPVKLRREFAAQYRELAARYG